MILRNSKFEFQSNCYLLFQNSIHFLRQITEKYALYEQKHSFVPKTIFIDKIKTCKTFFKNLRENNNNWILKIGVNSHRGE